MSVTDINDLKRHKQEIDELLEQARRVPILLFGPQSEAIKELASKDHWVVWKYVQKTEGSKPTKPPVDPRTGQPRGIQHHGSFEKMLSAVGDNPSLAGVGVVLKDDYIGLDLDHCISPEGVIDSWAQEILDLKETYAEISPSGKGIRLFARGRVDNAVKSDAAGVELYSGGRYLTVTGVQAGGAPNTINPAPKTLAALEARVKAFKPEPATNSAAPVDEAAKPFRKLNTLALERENLKLWVPVLFPGARMSPNGAWRVSSKSMGRDYDEDLSIAPSGIKDFGLHDQPEESRNGGRTAIDVILQYPEEKIATTAWTAAKWLCNALGLDMFELGFYAPLPLQDLLDLLPPLESENYTPKDRTNLLASEWLKLELPPREFLLGEVITSTTRWLISGETGVGKTLIGLDLAAAIACGSDFIHWKGSGARKRVLYFDGELPAETFKDRIINITRSYGEGIELYGYCRDVLADDDMPPINTAPGLKWVQREVLALKPDLVVFDSIMCLTIGNLSEEESWAPLKPLVRWLSRQRTAQIWLHHTGRNTTHSFGTTTREWEMDSTIMLTKADSGDAVVQDNNGSVAPFQWEFIKARLRTPDNYQQFKKCKVWRDAEGFKSEIEGVTSGGRGRSRGRARKETDAEVQARRLQETILATYRELASEKAKDGKTPPPIKIPIDAIKTELIRKGELEGTRFNGLSNTERSRFNRARAKLKDCGAIDELDGRIWELLSYEA